MLKSNFLLLLLIFLFIRRRTLEETDGDLVSIRSRIADTKQTLKEREKERRKGRSSTD